VPGGIAQARERCPKVAFRRLGRRKVRVAPLQYPCREICARGGVEQSGRGLQQPGLGRARGEADAYLRRFRVAAEQVTVGSVECQRGNCWQLRRGAVLQQVAQPHAQLGRDRGCGGRVLRSFQRRPPRGQRVLGLPRRGLQLGQPPQHPGLPGMAGPLRPLSFQCPRRRVRRDRAALLAVRREQERGPGARVAVSSGFGLPERALGVLGPPGARERHAFEQVQTRSYLGPQLERAKLLHHRECGVGLAALERSRGHLQPEELPQRRRVAVEEPVRPCPFLPREVPAPPRDAAKERHSATSASASASSVWSSSIANAASCRPASAVAAPVKAVRLGSRAATAGSARPFASTSSSAVRASGPNASAR
jgi:hypothetical protein